MCNDGTTFYALAQTGAIYSSTTGASWTLVTTIPGGTFPTSYFSLSYQNSTFFLFSAASPPTNAIIGTSANATAWTYATDTAIIAGAGQFAVNKNGLMVVMVSDSISAVSAYKNTVVTGTWPTTMVALPYGYQTSVVTLPDDDRFFIITAGLQITTDFEQFDDLNSKYVNFYGGPSITTGKFDIFDAGTTAIDRYNPNAGALAIPVPAAAGYLLAFCKLSETVFGCAGATSNLFFKFEIDTGETSYAPATAYILLHEFEGITNVGAHLYTAISPRSDPTSIPGCLLTYCPDESKFKRCDGVSVYTQAVQNLKNNYPVVTRTCKPVSTTNYVYQAPHLMKYVNSKLVYFLTPNLDTGTMAFYSSTTGGNSWTLEQSFAGDSAYSNLLDIQYDGSVYFFVSSDGAMAPKVFKAATLATAHTLTAFNDTNYPAETTPRAIVCFSTSSSFLIIGATGNVYQTTNQGTSWTLSNSLSAVVYRVVRYTISSTNYIFACTSVGIFRTTNMTSWTLVSATTNAYQSFVYNAAREMYVASNISTNTIEISLDGMSTWTSYPMNGGYNYSPIVGTVGEHFINNNGLISYDGRYFLNLHSTQTDGQTLPHYSIGSFLTEVVDFGSGVMVYGTQGSGPGIYAPYVITIDTTAMRMPINDQRPGLGVYMRIVD